MSVRGKPVSCERAVVEDKRSTAQSETAGVFAERHYTVAEVAGMWSLSEDAARRMFQNEPGVLILPTRTKGSKRRYTTLRIPQSVVERVHKRCSLVI